MSDITAMLLKHEGLKLFVYNDTQGIPTIGVGRNLRDRGLTKDEAMYLLANDIKDFSGKLSRALPWYDALPQDAKNVLLDMVFNLGLGGLLGFHDTLALIQAGKYIAASEAMLKSKWADQVGYRAVELSNILKSII
jgi:lysozyme